MPEPGPCLWCAALQARIDRAAAALERAWWFAGPPGDVAVLPAAVWEAAMRALDPDWTLPQEAPDA